jgi:hypothetical protein
MLRIQREPVKWTAATFRPELMNSIVLEPRSLLDRSPRRTMGPACCADVRDGESIRKLCIQNLTGRRHWPCFWRLGLLPTEASKGRKGMQPNLLHETSQVRSPCPFWPASATRWAPAWPCKTSMPRSGGTRDSHCRKLCRNRWIEMGLFVSSSPIRMPVQAPCGVEWGERFECFPMNHTLVTTRQLRVSLSR